MASATSSPGSSRSGGKGGPEGAAGSDRPAGPTNTELLDKISTLEQTLTTLMRLAGRADASARESPSISLPDADPKTARPQSLTRVRYEIINALLGRSKFDLLFFLATRHHVDQGKQKIVFTGQLPEEAKFAVLRSAASDQTTLTVLLTSRTELQFDGLLVSKPLEAIEIEDKDHNVIALGMKLDVLS